MYYSFPTHSHSSVSGGLYLFGGWCKYIVILQRVVVWISLVAGAMVYIVQFFRIYLEFCCYGSFGGGVVVDDSLLVWLDSHWCFLFCGLL
ncbi:unnamed protein product [Brassica oleracea]|uniref:Uncharacterized protein n=1 Tax=Brassica oleracea var. oleracea TaxID=109376 RepID=A0A0D3E6Y4_BRAOL